MESGRFLQTRFRHEPFHSMTETVGVEGLPVAPFTDEIAVVPRRAESQPPLSLIRLPRFQRSHCERGEEDKTAGPDASGLSALGIFWVVL